MNLPAPPWRPLDSDEVDTLATYNAEVWRGLVHTDEYRARMAELQARFEHPRNGIPAKHGARWWR